MRAGIDFHIRQLLGGGSFDSSKARRLVACHISLGDFGGGLLYRHSDRSWIWGLRSSRETNPPWAPLPLQLPLPLGALLPRRLGHQARQFLPGKAFPGNVFRGLRLAATMRGTLILSFPLALPDFAAFSISARWASLSPATLFRMYATSTAEVRLYISPSSLVAFSTRVLDHWSSSSREGSYQVPDTPSALQSGIH